MRISRRRALNLLAAFAAGALLLAPANGASARSGHGGNGADPAHGLGSSHNPINDHPLHGPFSSRSSTTRRPFTGAGKPTAVADKSRSSGGGTVKLCTTKILTGGSGGGTVKLRTCKILK